MKRTALHYIGDTPIIQINEKLYAKLDTYIPSGSVKDRMSYYLLSRAAERGDLRSGDTIVEASSGNTGIAFSMLGALLGHPVKIVMPCNMSEERKQMIRLFGAEVLEVGPSDFKGAIALRDEIAQRENHFTPRQFSNKDNIDCHYETTGTEIIRQVYVGMRKEISAFVSGAGTGGTIMGVSKRLKLVCPEARTVLVMPAEPAACHGIQGINDGADFLVDRSQVTDRIEITTPEATERAKRIAREHGLLVGISSGANVLAAERWIEENDPAGVVVTMLCDRGERYLSIFD